MLLATALLLGTLAATPPPRTFAVLVNGGGAPGKNYLSHLHHLQDMAATLRERGIPDERVTIFSSDGEDAKPDLTERAADPEQLWLVDGTPAVRPLTAPALTNTVWKGARPARRAELRKYFAAMRKELRPGDTLLLFVTDHGTRDPEDSDNSFISLWNESLSVLELRALLGSLKPGVRVVELMSQCYSGAFAESMTPLAADLPDGDVCGFYATPGDRPAYGCYPEGRDRDRIGHAFRFIDALARYGGTDAAHAAVVVADTTPDVPLRTSDAFLAGRVEQEAKTRGVSVDTLADELLTRAFADRARYEREIRILDRVGQVYGMFSPRSLGELAAKTESLTSLSKDLETYAQRWKLSLDDLRKENLARFLEEKPSFKERLEERRVESLDGTAKRKLVDDLLAAVAEFTAARPEVFKRLTTLRDTEADAREAQYRVDVRLAALLRMRTLLLRIAGITLVADRPEEAQALAALTACEAAPLGTFAKAEGPFPPDAPEPLPPFDDDLAAVRNALPSWLGIRFRPVPEEERTRLDLARGAIVVEQVYEEGPAKTAGLAAGDIINGPKDHPFTEPNQIREWTMTSPRGVPIPLEAYREGERFEPLVFLAPMPSKLPALPPPPKAGDEAPTLASLKLVRPAQGELPAGRRLLFFWATWCGPCKASLPELERYRAKEGLPIVAISDESPETIRGFLDTWTGPFPEIVASDALRRASVAYGVSGTPTFVLIGVDGKIEARQTGYARDKGLELKP